MTDDERTVAIKNTWEKHRERAAAVMRLTGGHAELFYVEPAKVEWGKPLPKVGGLCHTFHYQVRDWHIECEGRVVEHI